MQIRRTKIIATLGPATDSPGADIEVALAEGVRLLVQQGHIKEGDRIIMTMGEHTGEEGDTNSLRLVQGGENGYLQSNPSLQTHTGL